MHRYAIKKLERKLCCHTYSERVIHKFSAEDDAIAFMAKLYDGLVKQFGPSKPIRFYKYSGIELGYDTRYIIVKV